MKIIILLSMLTCTAFAGETTFVLRSSEISYTVNFPLKTVIGKSTEAKGKGICEKKSCEFLVAAPVKSFKSGDTNRDVHMQEVTKSSQHPLISLSTSHLDPENPSQAVFEIEFAGVKKEFKNISVKRSVHDNMVDIETSFPILLSDFKVERPTLLGIAIDDKVNITVKTQWDNQH